MVYTSEFTAAHTRARIGGRGEVAHIGIDVERFAPRTPDADLRRSHGIAPDDVVFAQVGALVPSKGHRLLLAAFERVAAALPSARLLIIGGGPESGALEQWVHEHGLSGRVHLLGYVADARSFFRHVIDVNVLASEEEGLGLVNLEASACELPTIGTEATGIRETIVHGSTGYLFPPADAEALAGYMMQLGRDAELRTALGREGRQFVAREFSVTAYSERVQRVMRGCIRHPLERA
jgi:glycosyltransferase involved in cell wall biosynthesis